jgi:hypothetical protein
MISCLRVYEKMIPRGAPGLPITLLFFIFIFLFVCVKPGIQASCTRIAITVRYARLIYPVKSLTPSESPSYAPNPLSTHLLHHPKIPPCIPQTYHLPPIDYPSPKHSAYASDRISTLLPPIQDTSKYSRPTRPRIHIFTRLVFTSLGMLSRYVGNADDHLVLIESSRNGKDVSEHEDPCL